MFMTMNYQSTDPRDLDLVQEAGFNWIATCWIGHYAENKFNDDLPVFFEKHKRIHALRKKRHAEIKQNIDKFRKFNEAARRRGLKVALFSYEISLPQELKQAYPELFYPFPEKFLKRVPEKKDERLLCVFDPRTQELIADKVAETLRNIGPVDAWLYTNHEDMWGAGLMHHNCANCSSRPRWQGLRLLRDAMRNGVERLPYKVELIHRFWGSQHPDGYSRLGKYLLERHCLEKKNNINWKKTEHELRSGLILNKFRPSRDLPPFMKSLEREPARPWIMSKATWSDYLLRQPPNPWIGFSKGKVNEIMELSIEPCHRKLYGFIPCLLLKQMQKHLLYGLKRGIKGVFLNPIESTDWGLNLANLKVGLQLFKQPGANLNQLLGDWLRQNYRGKFPAWLVRHLLASEDIWAELAAYNGISGLVNFDVILLPRCFLSQYAVYYIMPLVEEAFPDAAEKFDLSQKGFGRAVNNWNRQVARAKKMNATVTNNISEIPARARPDVQRFFDRLAVLTEYASLMQKLLFSRLALEYGKLEAKPTLMHLMEQWSYRVYYLIAADKEIQEKYASWKQQGKIYPAGFIETDADLSSTSKQT